LSIGGRRTLSYQDWKKWKFPMIAWKHFRNLETNNREFSKLDLVKINAFLCCFGIGIKATEYTELINYFEKRTGHGGLDIQIENNEGLELNTLTPIVLCNSTKDFPVILTKNRMVWEIQVNGKNLTNARIVPKPKWYKEKINGVPAFRIFQYENGNLMGTIPDEKGYQSCIYKGNFRCKFCGLEDKRKNIKPDDYAKLVELAYVENDKIRVSLTSGNTNSPQKGIENYLDYVKAIKDRVPKIQIEVEASPPSDFTILDSLKLAGMKSISLNIEVFDDKLRNEVCPGKASISKTTYLNALEYSNQVGLATYSALIVGLEPPSSTLRGVEKLAEIGTMVNPLPFKPMEGSVWQKMEPVSPEFLLVMSWTALKIMRNHKVNPITRRIGGCGLCGGCSLEVNLDKNYKNIASIMNDYITSRENLPWSKWW
jgi:hypothetical protein